MKDNVYDRYLSGSKKLKLVDYPGAESFRGELFSKWSIKVTGLVTVDRILIKTLG
jgi:hypothetical protein